MSSQPIGRRMTSKYLPYCQKEYRTEFSARDIGESLMANVIVDFSPFSGKRYYGGFTSHGFSVRRTSCFFLRKRSWSPTVAGSYEERGGETIVKLHISPHPAMIVLLCVFGGPTALLLLGSIPEAFSEWNPMILVAGTIPAALFYGVFWTVFQWQSSSDLRFWEHALRLREIPPLVEDGGAKVLLR